MIFAWFKDHPNLSKGILLGIGVTGAILYHSNAIAQTAKAARLMKSLKMVKRKIYVIHNASGWSEVSPLLLSEARLKGAVGFDCEWVQVKGKRRPVALLQLASCSGTCVLLRLPQMKSDIPETLKEFLADEKILKVGVGPIEDSNYLSLDYNMEVNGCVDLRNLVLLSHNLASEKRPKEMGLNALTQHYLGHTLDKDWRVRASDWEAEELTERQKKYAAEDALVGVHILMSMMKGLWTMQSRVIPFLPSAQWHLCLSAAVHQICFPFKDCKFSQQKTEQNGGGNSLGEAASNIRLKSSSREQVTRKGPLYHYSQLRAPDNSLLCVCDPGKALWYVTKGRGELVNEDPIIVRLNFVPSVLQMAKKDGQFYLQERLNMCVVCGKEELYMRKHIVPLEYRKHFPDILKDHQSHDIVLLCFNCHQTSYLKDKGFQNLLAQEFEAPLISENSQVKVKNAAKALLQSRASIPEKRIAELENIVKTHLNVTHLSEDNLHEIVQTASKNLQPHGQKVYEAYEKIGLIKLMQRWREHFLTSMNPLHMPEGWSVTHNLETLEVKMRQYPIDHPERLKCKIALVGTQGMIDIPYIGTETM